MIGFGLLSCGRIAKRRLGHRPELFPQAYRDQDIMILSPPMFAEIPPKQQLTAIALVRES